MTQIPASSISGGQTSPSSLSGSQKASEASHRTRSPDITGIPNSELGKRTQRLHQWHQTADIGNKIGHLNRQSVFVDSLVSKLSQIAQSVSKDASPERFNPLISDLKTIVRESDLNNNLQFVPENALQRSPINSDLFSPRPENDRILLALPDRTQVSVEVDPGAGPKEISVSLNHHLESKPIEFEVNKFTDELVAKGAPEMFSSAWNFRSSGPRGNEIQSLQWSESHGLLDEISSSALRSEKRALKRDVRFSFERLDEAQRLIKSSLDQLNDQASRLGLDRSFDSSRESDLLFQVRSDLGGGFESRIKSLRAQANLSSDRVFSVLNS